MMFTVPNKLVCTGLIICLISVPLIFVFWTILPLSESPAAWIIIGGVILVAIGYIKDIKEEERNISKPKPCRKCGLHKQFALEYGMDELCKECLMELVELQKGAKGNSQNE